MGLITSDVVALRDRFALPGMRVLQFAFDGASDSPYLAGNFGHNAVVYTGTHDNPTTRGWFEALPDQLRQNVWKLLKRPGAGSDAVAHEFVEVAWRSVAALAITPLQDVLNLGNEARMNQPGEVRGNWQWRCTSAMLDPAALQWLRDLTFASSRGRRGSRRADSRWRSARNRNPSCLIS